MSDFDDVFGCQEPLFSGLAALERADQILRDIGQDLARLHGFGSGVSRDELTLQHEVALADLYEATGDERALAARRVAGIERQLQVDAMWQQRERGFIAVENGLLALREHCQRAVPEGVSVNTRETWDYLYRLAFDFAAFAEELREILDSFPVLIAGQKRALSRLSVSRARLGLSSRELHAMSVAHLSGEAA